MFCFALEVETEVRTLKFDDTGMFLLAGAPKECLERRGLENISNNNTVLCFLE